ncbi:MAG TPA: extracellular solute-binding protein [Acidiphilium sp.]
MTEISRRQLMQLTAAGALAAGVSGGQAFAADTPMFPIEKGAKLQLLRWTGFIESDDAQWKKNTEAFTRATGVPVTIQDISWTDIQAKSGLAAELGSGPDIIMGFYDDPFIYPDKLVDVSKLCEYLSKKHGGFFSVAHSYGYDVPQKRWIAVPIGAPGAAVVYRDSWIKECGYDSFPTDFDKMLDLSRKLKKNNHPIGLALGHAVGDGNTWCHWMLWGFGAKSVDADNKVAIESKETYAALKYAKELYKTMIPGVSSWLDVNNNESFLAGQISMTINGISIWYVAQKKFPEIYKDTRNATLPVGPVGHQTMFNLFSQAFIFKYSKYPNAAQEYLRFMSEPAQMDPWLTGMEGYVTPALKDYTKLPVWTSNPNITPYRDALAHNHAVGYAGSPGRAAATALNDFVIVNMFADACVNGASPEDAARDAARQLKQIYGT